MNFFRETQRRIRFAVLAMTLSGAVATFGVTTAPAQAQQQNVVVPFTLLAPDGKAVENASIALSYKGKLTNNTSSGTGTYKTDAKGLFNFNASSNSKWDFTFWVNGVGSASVKDFSVAQNSPQNTDIRLSPGATIKINCVETSGAMKKPLGNIALVAMPVEVKDGTLAVADFLYASRYSTRSHDGDGFAEFAGIPKGTYILTTGNNLGWSSFAVAVELGATAKQQVVALHQTTGAAIDLKVVDSNNKPVVGKTFSLRTNYAPVDDSQQLFVNERVSLEDAVKWNQNQRFWPNGYPLPTRTFQTDAKGAATIYPMDDGEWKLTLLLGDSRENDGLLAEEITVTLTSGKTTPALIQIKPKTEPKPKIDTKPDTK